MSSPSIRVMTEYDVDAILPYTDGMVTKEQMMDRVCVWEGRHVALWREDILLACGGMTVFWHGVAEAWLELTPAGKAHPRMIYRALVAEQHAAFAPPLRLHRLQALVREDHDVAHRLLRHLQWTCEARLHQAAPDRTALYLYALVAK